MLELFQLLDKTCLKNAAKKFIEKISRKGFHKVF